MGKISDIWVRLGLKKEGFDKGMNDATKKAEGFGGSLNKIKAGAVAVWAAIGASVVAFGKKMIETTNAVGDKWALFTAQAKAGWNTFVQSLSAMNWDNFIGRFREAVSAAKELQSALDAEFEISNSIKLQKAAMAEELNALEILARNASKPYEERAAAAQKYLDMVRPIYEQEQALADKLLDAQQGAWLGGTGLQDTKQTRDDLTKFLVDYGKMNNGLADAIGRMRELQEQYDMALSVQASKYREGDARWTSPVIEEYRALRDVVKQFAQAEGYQTDIYKLAQVYETLRGDADTQPLVDALIRAGEAAGAYDRETKKMQSSLNASLSQINAGAGGIETPDIASVIEQAAAEMDAVTDTDIAAAVKHMEDVINDIDITAPSVNVGEIEAPAINTDKLRTSMDIVNEMLEEFRARTSEGLETSEAQVISFAEFKLPDISTTDLAAGLYEVESIIAQYEAILNSVDGEINPTIDTAGLEEALAKAMQVADEYRRQMQVVEEMNYMLEDAIVGSMANGMQALMDLAAGVKGVDMKSALAAFIAPLGDTMKQMGAMIMAEGLAMDAFKKSFSNPYAAIAAGAALMAVGSAVSAGLQRLTANPTGGTAASYNGAGSYGSAEVANYEHTLNIEVTGKISGSDIVISGKKTNDNWNR
jgi:hypothetical protein